MAGPRPAAPRRRAAAACLALVCPVWEGRRQLSVWVEARPRLVRVTDRARRAQPRLCAEAKGKGRTRCAGPAAPRTGRPGPTRAGLCARGARRLPPPLLTYRNASGQGRIGRMGRIGRIHTDVKPTARVRFPAMRQPAVGVGQRAADPAVSIPASLRPPGYTFGTPRLGSAGAARRLSVCPHLVGDKRWSPPGAWPQSGWRQTGSARQC